MTTDAMASGTPAPDVAHLLSVARSALQDEAVRRFVAQALAAGAPWERVAAESIQRAQQALAAATTRQAPSGDQGGAERWLVEVYTRRGWTPYAVCQTEARARRIYIVQIWSGSRHVRATAPDGRVAGEWCDGCHETDGWSDASLDQMVSDEVDPYPRPPPLPVAEIAKRLRLSEDAVHAALDRLALERGSEVRR